MGRSKRPPSQAEIDSAERFAEIMAETMGKQKAGNVETGFSLNAPEAPHKATRSTEKIAKPKSVPVVDPPPATYHIMLGKDKFSTGRIQLNAGQEQAFREVVAFIQNPDQRTHVLVGYAGTGKTTLVRLLVDYFSRRMARRNIMLTAPTHRAKTVLSRIGGPKADKLVCETVHQMLSLRPEFKEEELDLKNLAYAQQGASKMNYDALVVVDEASMINDGLYDVLVAEATAKHSQLLFVGDSAQLKPVKQKRISKVFLDPSLSELTEVMRQANGNPIAYLLQNIRMNQLAPGDSYLRYDRLSPSGEGILFSASAAYCREWVVEKARLLGPGGMEEGLRILCGTNKKVAAYNQSMRNTLHGVDAPEYVVGEIVTGYSNYGKDAYENYLITNSGDYAVVSATAEVRTLMPDVHIEGWQLTVREPGSKVNRRLFIVSRHADQNLVGILGEHQRFLYQTAQRMKKGTNEASLAWQEFFTFRDSFCVPRNYEVGTRTLLRKTLDYGYAMTVHKSQGGTYQYVFVDEGDIDSAFHEDHQLRHQLKYVAFSRASKQVLCLTTQRLDQPTYAF